MEVVKSSQGRQRNLPWPCVQLREVATFSSGSRNTNTAVDGGEFPFFVCSSEVLRCDEFDFETDAVIMAGNNADGVFHLHRFSGRFAARQRTYVISPRTDLLDCRWLYCQLERLQPIFQASAIGTTTRYVTIGMLRGAEIFLPDLTEQRAIAAALSDVDALLAKLDQFIAKKRDLKQAAMQQLLTGHTRLPGFSGEWEVKRLGEICEIAMGRTPPRLNSAMWGCGHVWLSIADIDGKVVSESKEQITDLAADFMPVIPKGTLLMSFKLSIGRLCFAGCDLYTNEAICSFGNLQADAEYLYYALGRTDFSLYGKQAVKGYTLNKESLKLVEVQLPPKGEQTAIATVLSDMDAELAALEARRDKTRALKQGMMQELLTGRIRLV